MSVAWPWKPPCGWWIRMRLLGSAERLPLRAAGQQQRAHRHRDPAHRRGDVGLDEAHRVVDRQAGVDDPARRVDVELDVLLGVLGLEVQQLRDDEVGDVVVDRRADEHDALAQQPRVDVERALTAGVLLHDDGDQGHVQPPSCVFRADGSLRATHWLQEPPMPVVNREVVLPVPRERAWELVTEPERAGDLARRGRRVRARGGRAAAHRGRRRGPRGRRRARRGRGADRLHLGRARSSSGVLDDHPGGTRFVVTEHRFADDGAVWGPRCRRSPRAACARRR